VKFLPSVVSYFFQDRTARTNVVALLRFVMVLALMMVVYAFVFQLIMATEGRAYSFIHGFYWTVVTMTTLGYGDITFVSDLGKAFSVLVLLSGVIFLLVMLPFTFIRFFYAPWLEAQNRARTPRKLRPDIQIISRAKHERSISKLHEAGADLVMSYASMGANSVINYLKGDNVLMVAEGLHVFREPTPEVLRNKTIAKSNIRARTNCSVIAVEVTNKGTVINPDPDHVLSANDELILIGTSDAERSFLTSFRRKH